MPLSVLDSLGYSANIRIKSVWDVVDGGDTISGNTYQCSQVGQSIMVQQTTGGYALANNFCEARHIVTGSVGKARGDIMRSRTLQVRGGPLIY